MALRPFGLTLREWDAAQLLGQGYSNKEIAAAMTVTTESAKFFVGRIMSKTDTRNRTECALALRGLLDA